MSTITRVSTKISFDGSCNWQPLSNLSNLHHQRKLHCIKSEAMPPFILHKHKCLLTCALSSMDNTCFFNIHQKQSECKLDVALIYKQSILKIVQFYPFFKMYLNFFGFKLILILIYYHYPKTMDKTTQQKKINCMKSLSHHQLI